MTPTLSSHFVCGLLAGAVRRGVDPVAVATRMGWDYEALNAPGARVTAADFSSLVRVLWDECEDELIGLTASPCPRGAFALACELAIHQETLGRSLDRFIAAHGVLTRDISLSLDLEGDMAVCRVRVQEPELDPTGVLQELWLMMVHRVASWLIARKIPVALVDFPYPRPPHADDYVSIFPGTHQFDTECAALHFSTRYVGLSTVRTESELARFVHQKPVDATAVQGEDTTFSTRVRTMILRQRGLPLTMPSLEEVAESMRMSTPTLRRRLREEGTTYRDLTRRLRHDVVLTKLADPHLSVGEIAHIAGFADAGNLTRAFKRWEGMSPTTYRGERGTEH
ncbi:MAG: AraC family transcriptional regulator [Myxococcales bacterium]|nr:AraC family transcriptional regulator [Myxococcales bacterium]